MREILFRGKRKDNNGGWVKGVYYKQTEFYGDPCEKHYIIRSTECLEYSQALGYYEVIPETVGQFTGLTDKNRNKVFEGDILYQKDIHGNEYVRLVKPEMSCGSCCTQVIGFGASGEGHLDYIRFDEPFEIVGNIHDNPELLEEQQ